MTSAQIQKDCKDRMDKAIEVFKNDLKGLRTGRASPALLDAIRVEYYGSPTPIKQLAAVSTPDPQQILIKPFDATALKDIEKAIRASDLGLAPNNDGKVIRLTIPPMSGEQRTKMTKKIKELAENAKVACRNVRRDGNKHFEQAEKDKQMTEDDRDKGIEAIQKLLKGCEGQIDQLAAAKSKEIMES
jgi:ribosome recycling factor